MFSVMFIVQCYLYHCHCTRIILLLTGPSLHSRCIETINPFKLLKTEKYLWGNFHMCDNKIILGFFCCGFSRTHPGPQVHFYTWTAFNIIFNVFLMIMVNIHQITFIIIIIIIVTIIKFIIIITIIRFLFPVYAIPEVELTPWDCTDKWFSCSKSIRS